MTLARLGVIASAFSDDPRQAAAMSRETGFAGLQFNAKSPSIDLTTLSASGRREFRRLLSNHALELIGLRADAGPKGLAPDTDVDRLLSHLDRILESAAGLAAPLVCFDLGPLPTATAPTQPRSGITAEQAGVILLPDPPAPPIAPPHAKDADPALVAHIHAVLLEIGRRADRYAVTLALRSGLSSFAALRQAMAAANCPWFGIDFDPVAAVQDGQQTDGIFSDFAGLVRHLRARDAIIGDYHRTRPVVIGHGSVDWPATLARLDESGFTGWMTLDPLELTNPRAAASEGKNFLARLLIA